MNTLACRRGKQERQTNDNAPATRYKIVTHQPYFVSRSMNIGTMVKKVEMYKNACWFEFSTVGIVL
jgi:hypothetical protein